MWPAAIAVSEESPNDYCTGNGHFRVVGVGIRRTATKINRLVANKARISEHGMRLPHWVREEDGMLNQTEIYVFIGSMSLNMARESWWTKSFKCDEGIYTRFAVAVTLSIRYIRIFESSSCEKTDSWLQLKTKGLHGVRDMVLAVCSKGI